MDTRHTELDLAYRLLDLDLVDSEGRRCGKVDDLEFDGKPGEATYLAAVISGPGALPARFPRRFDLRRRAARIFRGGQTRVSWDQIEDFNATVELRKTAAELGLGEGDRRLAELIPGEEED
jgi:sporulation protein YlmC with PRC-barrel domain